MLSHYWLTWGFLAAWLPLWPDSSLINQPDLPGLLLAGHVEVSLSADTNSAWILCNQNSPPHTDSSSGFLDSRITRACQAPSHCTRVVNLVLKYKGGFYNKPWYPKSLHEKILNERRKGNIEIKMSMVNVQQLYLVLLCLWHIEILDYWSFCFNI